MPTINHITHLDGWAAYAHWQHDKKELERSTNCESHLAKSWVAQARQEHLVRRRWHVQRRSFVSFISDMTVVFIVMAMGIKNGMWANGAFDGDWVL